MSSENDRAVLNTILNPLLPIEDVEDDEIKPSQSLAGIANAAAVAEAKDLELKGVKAAEAGQLDEAIELFNKAIIACPTRPSCYNNRAQGLRLKNDIKGAIDDLNKAVELSEGKGKACCQALAQRAMIYKLEGKDELARSDYEAAAALGSLFAKNQLTMMNPYAAMCNKMLSQVISQLQKGEPDDQAGAG